MTGYFAQEPRPLSPDDHVPARVLLIGALGVTPYIDRAMEVLQLAERGHDHEHRALVIARDGTVAALALFGAVAGAIGVSKLHAAVWPPSPPASDSSHGLDSSHAHRCAHSLPRCPISC